MPRKATHSGHCQSCGQVQKLPYGVLAKHGYTVEYSFFSGICAGTDEKPLEESCDFIKQCIASAEVKRDEINARAEEYRNPTPETKLFYRLYIPATWENRRSSYMWTEVFLVKVGEYQTELYRSSNGELIKGERFSQVEELHKRYLEHLESQIREIQTYINWQKARIRDWKPADLIPVKA